MTRLVAFAFFLGCGAPQPASSPDPSPCHDDCASPFGEALGENGGVVAYSNCRSACVVDEAAHLASNGSVGSEGTYTGLKWQCVEYARRWWLVKHGIVFASVDTADDMWEQIRGARRDADGGTVAVRAIANGSSEAPEVGDLLIYAAVANSELLPYGHVAVVVGASVEDGLVELAEQNFHNRPWTAPQSHARRLELRNTESGFEAVDPDALALEPGARIYGWLRPEL